MRSSETRRAPSSCASSIRRTRTSAVASASGNARWQGAVDTPKKSASEERLTRARAPASRRRASAAVHSGGSASLRLCAGPAAARGNAGRSGRCARPAARRRRTRGSGRRRCGRAERRAAPARAARSGGQPAAGGERRDPPATGSESTSSSACTRTAPSSQIRLVCAESPVVSRSKTTNSASSSNGSGAPASETVAPAQTIRLSPAQTSAISEEASPAGIERLANRSRAASTAGSGPRSSSEATSRSRPSSASCTRAIKANIRSMCKHRAGVAAEATILHADADSFFASVEQRDDPGLRGRPVIVGGGVVLAASYEAKAFGVRTAMGGSQALRLCPHAVVVPPRMAAYAEASQALYALFEDTTPLRRGALDRRGLPRRPRHGADRRHARGRSPSACAGRPRARRAPAHGRHRPHQAPREDRQRRRQARRAPPRPARATSSPSSTRSRSSGSGASGRRPPAGCTASAIATVGRARPRRRRPTSQLSSGDAAARHLHALANNRRPPPRPPPSPPPLDRLAARVRPRRASPAEIETDLVAIVDRVMRRLREARARRPHGRAPPALPRLRARDALAHASPADRAHRPILDAARSLLAATQPLIEERGLTLIGVTITNLENDLPFQLCLPLDPDDADLLDAALDQIRDRYGASAITRGILLGRRARPGMPLFPTDPPSSGAALRRSSSPGRLRRPRPHVV